MLDRPEDAVPGGDIGETEAIDDYLEGLSFPATREEVIAHLRRIGADDTLVAHVESLTGDRFERPDDVFSGIFPH